MSFFKGFKAGMHEFGDAIATIVNTFLLTGVYMLGVGVTSLFAKLVGKHFMQMKINKEESYWTDLNLKTRKIEEHHKQF